MSDNRGSAQIGVTGLAVMGRNLARNLARHGYRVALHNRTYERTRSLVAEHGHEGTFIASESTADFVSSLRRPRAIIIISAEHGQPFLQLAVATDGRVALGRVRIGHADFRLSHAGQNLVQAASLEYPVGGQNLKITHPGVLRQIADRSAAAHSPGGRLALASQHLQERGLASAVPADEADLVASRDLEGDIVDEQARASAQLKIINRDHRGIARSQNFSNGTKGTSVGPSHHVALGVPSREQRLHAAESTEATAPPGKPLPAERTPAARLRDGLRDRSRKAGSIPQSIPAWQSWNRSAARLGWIWSAGAS